MKYLTVERRKYFSSTQIKTNETMMWLILRATHYIIRVDGCHLKGHQKGSQLLTAVGIDGNDNIYPIALAVVEGELKETWSWFLTLFD
uniref:Putative ovule protein n=1 Tax=Solanum chacoense TaxID=4108 RepID=A0A0V0GKM5_SOLCH